jgi:hypothetical protein
MGCFIRELRYYVDPNFTRMNADFADKRGLFCEVGFYVI